MIDCRHVTPTRSGHESDIAYREDAMKNLLSDSEGETYRAMETEAQVCIANLVINGKKFEGAFLFVESNKEQS